MPATEVYLYQEADGKSPVRRWLEDLQQGDRLAFAKCAQAIERLAERGFELRRPHADMLRDGIYELRVKHKRLNYRILYFFHGRIVAILAHALTKENKVPPNEIDKALRRKRALEIDPEKHTYIEEGCNG